MSDAKTAVLTDLEFFSDPNLDRAVGLIFELAAQLHVTRQRHAALEQVLIDKQIISLDELDGLAARPDFVKKSHDALDHSLRQMMRVITEHGDPTGPLRAEAVDLG